MKQKRKTKEYFTVYDWMITDLRLKGSELLLYAIIYSFCKDGDPMITGLEYLANRIGSEKHWVSSALAELQKKGYITKTVAEAQKLSITDMENITHRYVKRNRPLCKTKRTVMENVTVTPYICNTNVLLNNNKSDNEIDNKKHTTTETKNKQEKGSQTDSYAEEILNNQSDRERMCMALKIDDDFLSEQLTNFCDEVKVKEKTHTDFRDFKNHFFNWLRIQVKTAKQYQNGNNKYHTTVTNCYGEDEAAKQQRLQSYAKLIQDLRSGKG